MAPTYDYDNFYASALKEGMKVRTIPNRRNITKRADMENPHKLYDFHQAAGNAPNALIAGPARPQAQRAATLHNASSNLVKLPAELRTVVWRLVLPFRPRSIPFTSDGYHDKLMNPLTLDQAATRHHEPALLQVCTEIREEAAALYCKQATPMAHEPPLLTSDLLANAFAPIDGNHSFVLRHPFVSLNALSVELWLRNLSTYALPVVRFARNIEFRLAMPFEHTCATLTATPSSTQPARPTKRRCRVVTASRSAKQSAAVWFRLLGERYYVYVKIERCTACTCEKEMFRAEIEEPYQALMGMVLERFGERVIEASGSSPVVSLDRR
ncbi:hypothetical protein LTR36_004833 [Oleoguttula mirabilis]|uniref:2EXR domain-containing protein n=1 Tax=Oleoguttula mirabilis TaxID=1507867 RepID=A0AAV9JER0_9PEZI|nr:hypothetical protein LTR36_004833 [Oleoguttula mirabilis]